MTRVSDKRSVAQNKCRLTQRAPDPRKSTETMVVGLQLRCVRVFRRFRRLEVVSDKTAFSRPAHQYP